MEDYKPEKNEVLYFEIDRHDGRHVRCPARYIRNVSGYEIHIGQYQILRYTNESHMPPSEDAWVQRFKFPISEKRLSSPIIEIPYSKLLAMNLKIVVYQTSKLKQFYQRPKLYFISGKNNNSYPTIYEQPKDVIIEYDVLKRLVRLRGTCCITYDGKSHGRTDWISITQNKKSREYNGGDPYETEEKYFMNLLGEELAEEIRYIEIPIQHIPKAITPDGELVCIPRGKDMYTSGSVGQKRKGKSFSMISELEQMYTRWNIRIGVLNDIVDESRTWCRPNHQLHASLGKYGLKPMGLPMIYLYQNIAALQSNMIAYPGDLGFRITMSTSDVIDNFFIFQQLFDLKPPSMNYFQQNSKIISKARNVDELKSMLIDSMPGDKPDAKMNIIGAISRVMGVLYKEKLLDSSTGIPAQWKLVDPQNNETVLHPFLACLMVHTPAGSLIPTNVNFYFNNSPFLKSIFYKSAQPVFKMHNENQEFRKIGTMLFCDEITKIASRRSSDKATDILNSMVQVGGPLNLGTHWATNTPADVSETIFKNTSFLYLFSSQKKDTENALKQFLGNSPKALINTVMRMKKHNFMALTSEKFIKYDRDGTPSEIGEGEPEIGKSIPRLSLHRKPGSEGIV